MKVSFSKKLLFVIGTKQFSYYLFLSFRILALVAIGVISGLFKNCLWLGAVFCISAVILDCIIIVRGVEKVYSDISE